MVLSPTKVPFNFLAELNIVINSLSAVLSIRLFLNEIPDYGSLERRSYVEIEGRKDNVRVNLWKKREEKKCVF